MLLLLKRRSPPVVYLAGGTSDWRDHVRERWADTDVVLLDPFMLSDQQSLATFTLDDLALIDRSRCVLAYHDYHVYGGLAVEVGYAAARERMVVYVCKQPRLDLMIAALSKGVFTELDPALEFIERKLELRPCVKDPRDLWGPGHHGEESGAMTGFMDVEGFFLDELEEDVEVGQVLEECCHGIDAKHSHDYVVGGPGEMRCCHKHVRVRPTE